MTPAELADRYRRESPLPAVTHVANSSGAKGIVSTDFDRAQYCRDHQLSVVGQIAANSSRTLKLHVRDKENYLMCVA